MKPTEERLLNAGFERRGKYYIKPMLEGYVKGNDPLELGLVIESLKWFVNYGADCTNIIDNLDFDKKGLTEKKLNVIYQTFTGKTLNFEPPTKIPYKGHEDRIKELEEKVKDLTTIVANLAEKTKNL